VRERIVSGILGRSEESPAVARHNESPLCRYGVSAA
jgi:hypothetical protein